MLNSIHCPSLPVIDIDGWLVVALNDILLFLPLAGLPTTETATSCTAGGPTTDGTAKSNESQEDDDGNDEGKS